MAAGAVQLGLKTVLIENHKMGGDCLNAGCVPSKAFLAAAKRAMNSRKDNINGIAPHEPIIDFAGVKKYVASVIKKIEPNDSVERFQKMGVKVIMGTGEFVDKNTIQAGNNIITARYVVIATGSRAVIPPIAGLKDIDKSKVLTNETIFQLKERPDHLIIIGGGPIGMEMGQAHVCLGCPVSIIDHGTVMPRDDQKAVAIVKHQLIKDGIAFYEGASIKNIKSSGKNITVTIVNSRGKTENITGSHILLAAGRQGNIQSLHLDRAGIKHNGRSITVDNRLRTNRKNIYAIGDCNGGPQFTHAAGYQAGIIIRQVCFKMPAKVNYAALPWVTYTSPELAQVGMNEAMAAAKYGKKYKVATWPFHENDRAVAEGETDGFAKIIADKKSRVIGGTIVGPHAGDMILTVGLAINKKCTLGDLAGVIAPYPSRGEIIKRAAGSYYTPILFSNKTRRVVKLLQWLP